MLMGARGTESPGIWSYNSCEAPSAGCWDLNTDPLPETAPALPPQGPPTLLALFYTPFPLSLPPLQGWEAHFSGNPEPGRMAEGGGWLFYVSLW